MTSCLDLDGFLDYYCRNEPSTYSPSRCSGETPSREILDKPAELFRLMEKLTTALKMYFLNYVFRMAQRSRR
jgi:hypothetical protein